MSATLFKEVNYSLSKLVQDIEMGEIALPEIQRPFVWPNTKVRDLFDSMYRGFPVGYLLFWSTSANGGAKQVGTDHKQKAAKLLIVDGQQRLTSLYAVLRGVNVVREDYTEDKIKIGFRPNDESFEVADATIARNAEYIPDISAIWDKATGQFSFIKAFLDQLRSHHEVSKEEENRVASAIAKLYALESYPFTALELSSSVNEEQVAEVFVRINSKGTPLIQADFILTLMSVFWEEGRKELEDFCRQARIPPADSKPSSFNYFIKPTPDQLIRSSVAVAFGRARLRYVYSILRGKDLDTEEFSTERRDQQFATLRFAQAQVLDVQNWQDYLKCLRRAGYRSDGMITSETSLLYVYAIYLIGKRLFSVDHFALSETIARWFFFSALTSRYTGSSESQMEEDLAAINDCETALDFLNGLESRIRQTFTNDYWAITLPGELATASARSPALFAYYAALNLLDALGLFSKVKVSELLDPVGKGKKSPLERHHIFPKGYLETLGTTARRETNQIANYALVEWADNIAISDDAPAEYAPKYYKRFTSDQLSKMLHWHALPTGWENMKYEDFLANRRVLMAGIVREGFSALS